MAMIEELVERLLRAEIAETRRPIKEHADVLLDPSIDAWFEQALDGGRR
ncbi:MAG: hypothetical protein AAF637_18530 [Pseudomonadota bacterium]